MFILINYLARLWHDRKARATDKPASTHADAQAGTRAGGSRRERPSVTRHSAASRGRVALFAHQVRYDLRASLRNPRARFFTFFFPIVLLVIFAGVFGNGTTTIDGVHVKLSRFYLSGILAMSIVVASYANLVISIAALRESGVLKRRRATPASPSLLIAGQAFSTVVVVTIMADTPALGRKDRITESESTPGALAAIACVTVLATLTFACIGYAVSGMVGSPDAAQPIVQATMMPLWFLSGVFIPAASLSSTLRSVGSLFPVEHLASDLQIASVNASFTSAVSVSDLLALAAWGLAAAAFAAWRFSWLPSCARG